MPQEVIVEETTAVIDQLTLVVAYLLGAVAAPVMIAVEEIKRVFLVNFLENKGEQYYIASIYTVRLIIGAIWIAVVQAVPQTIELFPALASYPTYSVFLGLLLITVGGTSMLHFITDILGEFRLLLQKWNAPDASELDKFSGIMDMLENIDNLSQDYREGKYDDKPVEPTDTNQPTVTERSLG